VIGIVTAQKGALVQENRFSMAYPGRKRKSKRACLETI